jgi:hypothetical protein
MVEGVNSGMIYLIYCKNFYKWHNVPPSGTTIKKKKKCEDIRKRCSSTSQGKSLGPQKK